MRFSGYTDPDDWHWMTLVWMVLSPWCWNFELTRRWRLSFHYFWYDGPIFQLCVGPLCFYLQ